MMEKELFDDLIASLREAGATVRGEREPTRRTHLEDAVEEKVRGRVDSREIRERLRLTRGQFAALIGVSERTVEGWEQGRRRPSGPALTVLRVAEKHPESVLDTMRPSP